MQKEDESRRMWIRFLSGDNGAYEWLYTEHVGPLYRYGLHFGVGAEGVEDCIQEVFAGIYRNRKRQAVPEHVATYLMVSLKNCLLRSRQRIDRTREAETDGALDFLLEPTVEDTFIDNEQEENRRKAIEQILDLLTPRQKEILYYRYIRELEMEDVCRLMELSYQSAQNLIQRSLKKIRENFKKTPSDWV
ncbi:MAG: sigma-70 family RNA polymerase sigma factor [Tannerellaceae bacterium]|jgi:RNA polymerase sigma factor (sigma-70 family)|nr:sigma-70 family RNA polymerase sigma factor [Tannerellaceae bacterium]